MVRLALKAVKSEGSNLVETKLQCLLVQSQTLAMYYQDLTLCNYHGGPYDADCWNSPLLSVGWLEHPHVFPAGDVPVALLERIESFIAASWDHYPGYAFRGPHECSICACGEQRTSRPTRSHLNIWVPGDGVVYIAPGMITHYIGDHGYVPPEGFIQAILSCPDYGSPAYCSALLYANAGQEIPLLEMEAGLKERWEKVRKESMERNGS